MAPQPKPKPPAPKGKAGGSIFTRKVGPLPLIVWVIAAVGAYLAYRHFAGGGATSGAGIGAASPTTPTAETGAAGMGGGPGGTVGTGGGGDGSAAGGVGGTTGPEAPSAGTGGLYDNLIGSLLASGYALRPEDLSGSAGGSVTTAPAAGAAPPVPQARTAATTSNFGAHALAATQTAEQSGGALRFGGVQSVRTLKSGATLTTYKSGRQVEQKKGKAAYVVHR